MNGAGERRSGGGGPIGIFARHPTAANLLMALLLIVGFVALTRLNTQFFPDFGIDIVTVTVDWPGASAEDVDSTIIQAIEPEVRFLDGVKRVRSVSFESRAVIVVEFVAGTDMQGGLADVETGVAQVTTLPENSEKPVIQRVVRYDLISQVLISGPYPEASLKAIAKRMRNDLLSRGIDKVDLEGARDEEIWVEIEAADLRRLNMTIGDVAARIADISQDVPSGTTAGAAQRQIRSLGLLISADELARLEVRARETGAKVYLGDIARVREAFDDDGTTAFRDGQQAVILRVQRATTADALDTADIVDRYLAETIPTLPPNLTVEQFDVQANLIRSRVSLLLRNGAGGLALVLIILFLFLNLRVGFWVAVGIPVSLFATMLVMLFSGQSINMVSLFGMIMALGIIVDDAIVVGEHAEARYRGGMGPIEAAEAGARRMAAPVLASSLTTIAAFLPLFVVSDIIGQIIRAIPFVVVSIIVASLVECFLVLPGHLRGALSARVALLSGFRRWFDGKFERFQNNSFRRFIELTLEHRYSTLTAAFATLIVCVGLIQGGRIAFVFFPQPEVDKIFGNVESVAGTGREKTLAMLERMEEALRAADRNLSPGAPLVRVVVAQVGNAVGQRPGSSPVTGDHVGGLIVELEASENRDITAAELLAAWRTRVKPMPGTVNWSVTPVQAGPPGREIDVRLSGADPVALKSAAGEVRVLLARYPGVSDIEDDLPYGKREAILELTPTGRAMGFTTASVGRQVRHAFEGAIAKRFARGGEEVTVRVQYPRAALDLSQLDSMYLRGPGGVEAPLRSVVSLREKQGFARIKREDGVRQVSITSELDKSVTTNDAVLDALIADGLPDIAARYGVRYHFAGKFEEQAATLADMRVGAIVGLICIYIILAWVFGSYTRPLVVMSVIPLAFVGATIGHLVLGFDLTILSMVALIGLSGIVVNNSIILVSVIDERLHDGQALGEAIAGGTRDRLRAVILTSATTIGGLTPLMFESDLQAQFLIPMAVTLVFGLMVATLMVLVVVPSLLRIQGDLGLLKARQPAAAE